MDTKYFCLIIYLLLFSIDLFTSRSVFLNREHVDSRAFKIMQRYHLCYFTTWNLIVQCIFFIVAISEEILGILSTHSPMKKSLNKIRNYLFVSIVFPITLQVFSVFWAFFLYNRELIFPDEVDKFIPLYFNHLIHTVIILPLITEIFLSNSFHKSINFKVARKILTIYLFSYFAMYLFIHFAHGHWLYPFFYKLNYYQIVVFGLSQYFIGLISSASIIHVRRQYIHNAVLEKNK